MKYAIAIICSMIAVYFISTAPALWWMPDTEKAELIKKVERERGTAEAEYIKSIM